MREVIGSAPYEEDCVQVTNTKPYLDDMIHECRRFKNALEKKFPPPKDCRLVITRNLHDFGTYFEVEAEYPDEMDDEMTDWLINMTEVATWKELEGSENNE